MTPQAAKEHVLLVDDEPQILVALEDLLSDQFVVLKAPSAEIALDMMKRTDDIAVVVTDQRMPDMGGDELVARLGEKYLAQKILVTGYADLGAVVRAVNEGNIFAYVTKPWDEIDLRSKVKKAAAQFRLSQDLATEKQLLNDLMDHSPDGIYFKDCDLRFIRANKSIATWLGRDVDDLVGQRLRDVARSEGEAIAIEKEELASLQSGQPILDTIRQEQIEGKVRWFSERKAPILGFDRGVAGLVGISRDITHQRQLEQQFLQAQKMEAIGRLAGGVAHDFNNLLVVIQGYGELVQSDFSEDAPHYQSLAELLKATDRAAALTKQLLTFSRKHTFKATLLDLNEVVEGVVTMVKRLIHENIRISVELSPIPLMMLGDVTQIEQVILNLAINARDAMGDGGELRISTDLRDEENIRLRVEDSGTGMTSEVQARIFEPFFSTKEVGKGTGLGLSTVYGIVQQLEGKITVESELSVGTTFEVSLPRTQNQKVGEEGPRPNIAPVHRTGTILIVEDDEAVRRVTQRILTGKGYTVIEASTPSEAEAICARASQRIDLLLTDIIMPEMDGPALAKKIVEKRPELRVLFMSGYSQGHPVKLVAGGALASYIEKPFSPLGLTTAVHDALRDESVS